MELRVENHETKIVLFLMCSIKKSNQVVRFTLYTSEMGISNHLNRFFNTEDIIFQI